MRFVMVYPFGWLLQAGL